MSYGAVDDGGAQPIAHNHFGVDSLTGPKGKPDYKVTLTAEKAPVRLASGQEVNAWTFNGSAPGPELRIRQGDLVQVTLVNKDIGDGVTIHWHGLDVPNAEDGVAGVTQNAVEPGGRYVYRFRPEQVGTFWYHTHQDASAGREAGALRRPRHRSEAAPSRSRPRPPGAHVLGSHGDRHPRRRLAQGGATGHARSPAADQHRQRIGEVPALRDAPVRGRDRRRRHRTGSGSAGRADRDRSRRPLRHRVPHARRCRIRRGRKLQSRARAQPGWNREPDRDSVRADVRPGGSRADYAGPSGRRTSTVRSSSRSARRSAFSTAGQDVTGR